MSDRDLRQDERLSYADPEADRRFQLGACRMGNHEWQHYDSTSLMGPWPMDDLGNSPRFECTLWEVRRCSVCKIWDHRPLPQHPQICPRNFPPTTIQEWHDEILNGVANSYAEMDDLWPQSLMSQAMPLQRAIDVVTRPLTPTQQEQMNSALRDAYIPLVSEATQRAVIDRVLEGDSIFTGKPYDRD